LGLEKASIEPLGLTPENASIFISKENDKWGRVIKEAGIKAE
jgi:tripartite-type tricarboxylate transporter receptor subunit TctC